MKNNEQKSIFTENQQGIKKLLGARFQMVNELQNSFAKTENIISIEDANRIGQHCSQYTKINSLVNGILKQSKNNRKDVITGHEQFWKQNQKMQRILEQQLRELKSIDITIDNIVNEQFDKCNEIDEIEETIRIILSKKQSQHIERAEPYFIKKQNCLEFMKNKKQQKESIKQHKLNLIKKILYLLDNLRKHREAGLTYCLSKPQDKNQVTLLNRAIYDLKQMIKNKQQSQHLKKEQKELMNYVKERQSKIQQISKELLLTLQDQTAVCQQLWKISRIKSESEYFEKIFKNSLGLNPEYNIEEISAKLEKFEIQLNQKQKQAIKIQQGIQTTNNTIQIFEHIYNKIESENERRKNLIGIIQDIKNKYLVQDKAKQQILQMESDIDKMELKKNKLLKTMENKANEADVRTYKHIYSEIEQIDKEVFQRKKHIFSMKKNIQENSKHLYKGIIEVQEDYSDILSQTVPNLWIQEFSQSDSGQDINMYLTKTFKRLSIGD